MCMGYLYNNTSSFREACREIINQRLTSDVIFTDADWDSILFKTGGCSGDYYCVRVYVEVTDCICRK